MYFWHFSNKDKQHDKTITVDTDFAKSPERKISLSKVFPKCDEKLNFLDQTILMTSILILNSERFFKQ